MFEPGPPDWYHSSLSFLRSLLSAGMSRAIYKYIDPQKLKAWIDSGKSEHGSFVIIDVRDDDYAGVSYYTSIASNAY